jgi:hypothetical protein
LREARCKQRRHGSPPARPITPFALLATTIEIT